ncbi:MAG: substrate-binding domain-containing protein [Parabacteroides sp.]|nr:substrate-binding domain-containing protein [Parabacteroides sp.]
MKNIVLLGFVACLGCVCGGCKKQTPEVYIGFSQCTGGEWREQMNRQMRSEINFYENTRLEIRNANGKVEQQIADIHYFIAKKADLLIISPFEDKALVEAFNRIDFGGIPILLVDRNLSSNKHVAYVGASNLEVGKIAARFALKQLGGGKARILLIRGYEKSSVTFEREEGFLQIVKTRPDIEVVTIDAGKDVDGKDLSETRRIIHENRHLLQEVDAVYAFNDAMAMIASDEARKMNLKKNLLFIGVDGRMGYDGGIEAVRNGLLDASVVYPTGGDKAIEVAMKIINKIPVQKYISLPLTLIEPANVEPYYQQSLVLQEYANKIEVLHTGKTELLKRYVQQQRMLEEALVAGSVLLLLLIAAGIVLYRKKKTVRQLRQAEHRLEEQLHSERETNALAHRDVKLSDICNHLQSLITSYTARIQKQKIATHLQFDIKYQQIVYNVSAVDMDLSIILAVILDHSPRQGDLCVKLDSVSGNTSDSDRVRVRFILMNKTKTREIREILRTRLGKPAAGNEPVAENPCVSEKEDENTYVDYYFPLILPESDTPERDEETKPDASGRFKAEIEELMQKHYADYDFCMSVLVNELALSRMQLYRKFKTTFNETPNNYIRKYRLKQAVELIRKGELSFSEIAYQVGYNSPAYFTKCFREEFQCTPSEYLAKEKEK